MEVRFTLRFHRSNSSYCASSAATCSAVNSTMPASRRVRASANTAQAQVDIQNRNRGRGNTRNPRRLTQCFRPHTFELGLHLAGKAGYTREAELRRDRPPPGVFHPLHLALLLRDIATVLDLRFDGSHQTAHWLLAERLPNPAGDLRNRRIGPLQPLTVRMALQSGA